MNLKTFIVCLDKNKALDIAKTIISKDDDYSISPMFTTNSLYKDEINENYEVYMNPATINLSYKNNALLYIKTSKYISVGITMDDFYNNDICIMNINEYNTISENIFNKYDIITIWIDTRKHKSLSNNDLIEINYFSTFLEKTKYLYFLDNEENISETILNYLNGDDEERKILLEENN